VSNINSLQQDLGQVTAIVGAQWGDEGKGKVTDILAEQYDIIARACGGANAGHTIKVGEEKHVFHLLPSGSLHDGKLIVLGSGMVIHLPTLLEEIDTLKNAGIDVVDRLRIATNAHILFDYHKEIDGILEERRTKSKGQGIGTTKRGIGPAYFEKAMRSGIRMGSTPDQIRAELESKQKLLTDMFGVTIDIEKEVEQILLAEAVIGQCRSDVSSLLYGEYQKGKTIIIEGAQGALLDIDHGTYPFVTSSSTTTAGALQGLGLPPQILNSTVGIAKAYCTRVGSGDFPTEEEGELGNIIRERGGEYGATTGRPRRCGWLDVEALRTTARINGITHWNITKLDVLDELETVPVCVSTKSGKPEYKQMQGWRESTVGMTDFGQLPPNAQKYIEFIESETKVPVSMIGTGPERSEMILRK